MLYSLQFFFFFFFFFNDTATTEIYTLSLHDAPDLRFGFSIADWTAQVKPLGVPFFQPALKDGARIRGLAVQGGGALSRKDVDQLAEAAKQLGGAGLAWVKRQGEQISG